MAEQRFKKDLDVTLKKDLMYDQIFPCTSVGYLYEKYIQDQFLRDLYSKQMFS